MLLHMFVRNGHLKGNQKYNSGKCNSKNGNSKNIATLNNMDISSHKLAHKA